MYISFEARKWDKKLSKISDGKKKIDSPKKVSNVEQKHQEKINYFEQLQKSLPKKKIELINLEKSLDTEKKILKILTIQKSIKDCQKTITDIENRTEETEYFLLSGKSVFEYMNIIQTEEKILGNIVSSNSNKKVVGKKSKKNDTFSFFSPKKDTNNNNFQKTKNNIIEEYYDSINEDYNIEKKSTIDPNVDPCNNCDSYNLIFDNGSLMCFDCGVQKQLGHISSSLSYTEKQDREYKSSTFTYDKMNHLEDWLKSIQGKQNTHIPQEVLDNLYLECKKHRITDLKTLTIEKMKQLLKKLNYNDYYEHSTLLIQRMNKIPPLQLSKQVEDTFKSMFKDAVKSFENHKSLIAKRKNFLSYSYTLYKFCELLELDHYKKYFKLLKSTEKLQQQDLIFKEICKDLNWQFIPST